ncbi:MAG: DUF167 domain-containing protein [Anaerolineaceae bacterium]
MAKSDNHMKSGGMGAAITVRITPRSSRNEISEIMPDGTIKIKLTAPPVDGAANESLIKFLAEVLDTAPSRIEIVAGQTGRDKLITIMGLDSATVHERIVGHVKA